MAGARGARRDPDSGRRIFAGRLVRLPAFPEGPGARAEPHRCAPPDAAHRLGEGPGIAGVRHSRRRAGLRPRTLDRRAADSGLQARRGRRPVGGRAARGARLRALSLSAERAGRSRPGAALPQQPSLGFLRFRLPLARGRGLLRGALAQGRDRRPACGRLAQFRARPGTRRIPEEVDRGLPSRGHPGVRLVRTAARQREVLGRSSGVAREDRDAAGRATGLAQADEPDQSRVLPRGQRRRARPGRPVRLGRRQPGRTLLRVAGRHRQPEPLHADECGRARAVPAAVGLRPAGTVRRAHGRSVAPAVSGFPRRARAPHAGGVARRSWM